MRQPRKTQTWERNDSGGMDRVITLDPIDIQGDPDAILTNEHTVDVPAIDIQGRRERGLSTGVGRDAEGRSNMLPEWVPTWATDALGQPVRDDRSGVVGYEVPAWAAEFVADSEGQMPTSMLGAGAEIASNLLVPGRALYRQATGEAPSAEARTINPLSATMGAVDAASFGFADDIAGLFDEDTGRELADARRYAQRQDPGSFAIGEAGGSLPSMLLPGVSQGRGATTGARVAGGALEGAGWGALEGVGRSDADTLTGRLQDALPGALGGAVLGGGFAGASSRAEQRAAQPVDEAEIDRLIGDAAWEHLSQAGAAQSSRRQRMLASGTDEAARTENARRMVEQLRGIRALEGRGPGGVLPASEEAIQGRVREAHQGALAQLGQVRERMASEAVDGTPLLEHMRERVEALSRIPGAEAQTTQMRGFLRQFEQRVAQGPLSFDDLQRWKSHWRTTTNFDSPLQSERQGVYDAIRDTMQQGVADVDPALGQQYQDARRMARTGFAFSDMSADRARNEARNRSVSLTDYLAGLTGLGAVGGGAMEALSGGQALGAVAAGTGIALANRALRANEHGLNARRLERAARQLQTAPQRFGAWTQRLQAAQARGPRAFAAALYTAAQSDAAVRAQLAQEEDEQATRDDAVQSIPEVSLDELDVADIPEISLEELDALSGGQ